MSILRRAIPATAFLLSILPADGRPAPPDEAATPVVGNVVLDGKSLASGRIFFFVADDEFVGSKIKYGKFKVTRMPVGTWKVVIEGVGAPAKYATDEQSGLTVRILGGNNVIDFQLTR